MTSDPSVRTMPHSLESEASLLGAILLCNDAMDLVNDQILADDFYDPKHRLLWETMTTLHARRCPMDPVTLRQELDRRGRLADVGGVEAITYLYDLVPSAESAESYAELVRDHALLRRLIHESKAIQENVFQGLSEPAELLEDAEHRIYKIAERRITNETVPLAHYVEQLVMQVLKGAQVDRGLGLPFPALTRLMGGFRAGELHILAARPSMGKTALALRLAEHIAVEEEVGVAIFSLEMTARELTQRLLSLHARVSNYKLRQGQLNEIEKSKLASAAGTLEQAPIFLDDSADLTPLALRAKARRLVSKHGVGLVIVDYLQLMGAGHGMERAPRHEQVAMISRMLKQLARELEIPVLCLSQLNREAEKREKTNFKPRLADLRESGSIEQDADSVLLLHRRDKYENAADEDRNRAELIIAKQRAGPTGTVELTFLDDFLRFEQRETHLSDADAPPYAAAFAAAGGDQDLGDVAF